MADPTFDADDIDRLRERLAKMAEAFLTAPSDLRDGPFRQLGYTIAACHEAGETLLGNALIDLAVLRSRMRQDEAAIVLMSLVAEQESPPNPRVPEPSRN